MFLFYPVNSFHSVHCCTWNVGDEKPGNEDLSSLLGVNARPFPDVISVANCWAIWIFAFLKRNLLPAVTNIESEVTASGYAGVMDYFDIIDHQSFRDEDVNVILDHDKKQRVPAWTDRILYMVHRDFALDHHLNLPQTSRQRSVSPSRRLPVRGPPSQMEEKFPSNESVKEYPCYANLDISYRVLDPPGLLRLSESNLLLSPRESSPVCDFTKLLLLNTPMKSINHQQGENSEKTKDDMGPLAPPTLQTTSFDWIGLYPAEFADLERDYITYVYASSSVSQTKHRKNSLSSALLQAPNAAKFQECFYKAKI
ncbi:unnamed protein product, partial [Trichobilharzia regenti]